MSPGTKKTLILVSVVLNVLLAGMLIGKLSHHYIAPPPPPGFNIAEKISKFSPEKRTIFNSIMGPAKQKMDENHKQIDQAKKEAFRILASEPFNRDAYLLQVRTITDMHVAMKYEMAKEVAKLAAQLNPQEREILADIVSHPPFALPPGAMTEPPPRPAP